MPGQESGQESLRRPLLITCALVVASTVSWRRGVYYSGGLDPVVLFKALLNFAAIAVAFNERSKLVEPRRYGTRSVFIVAVFIAVSTFGGFAAGASLSTLVLSTRLALTALVVILLLGTYAPLDILRSLCLTMGAVGLLAMVTGVPELAATGRLAGGIPPIAPNELSLLCAVPVVYIAWRFLAGESRGVDGALLCVFLGGIWLTGSRTGLLALILGIAVMVLQAPRLPVPVFAVTVLGIPIAFFLLITSGLLSSYIERGGTGNNATLNSRTIAWSAALDLPGDVWRNWFGGGLGLKQIPVQALYWDVQGLDSSWIGALVQAGIIGMALLGVFAVATLVSCSRVAKPDRLLWTGMAVFLILRSFLESGLMDSTPAFLVFFTLAAGTEETTRQAVTPARRAPADMDTQAAPHHRRPGHERVRRPARAIT